MTISSSNPPALRLVHLTDPHLFGDPARGRYGVPSLPALRAVLADAAPAIAAAHAILATGDLVQHDPEGYGHFRAELARFGRPVLCLPGNHDEPALMRAWLPGPPFQVGGLWDLGPWRVALLDSSVPGETGGALGGAMLAWLEQAMVHAGGRHVLVCLHHPPVTMNSRWLDAIGLANGPALTALVRRFPAVRAIVFGHVHQALDTVVDGLRLIATPSTGPQFRPLADDFEVDDRPPAWRELLLHADGRIDTQLHWLEGWQAPAPGAAGGAAMG